MIEISEFTATAGNGHKYCNKPREIVELAERLGLSRMDIARIANVDPSTVRNWIRKNEAAFKPISRLVAHLNAMEKPSPIQSKAAYADVKNTDPHIPASALSSVDSPLPLTPIQTGYLGEINAVLATMGKTLAVVNLP